MKKNKKIGISISVIAIVLVAAIVFSTAITSNHEIPQEKSVKELESLGDVCTNFQIGDKVYVLDCATFASVEERHMAVCLQGIVAKTKPEIFIVTNEICHDYLDALEKSGVELIYNDENGEKLTLKALLNIFKASVGENGYTLYKQSPKGEGLNIATNLAVLHGWLPVPESLKDLAEGAGLVLKEDLTDDKYNADFQEAFFDEHKESFNYNAVVSLQYECTGLRDLAIQQGFYTFYIDDDEDTSRLRKKIFEYAGENTAVLGWAKYEVKYVTEASERGCYVLPSDHSHNNSLLASLKEAVPTQVHEKKAVSPDSSKHYCALVFSDGDNIQWIQNGYSEYFQKLALKQQFPLTWSFSPSMQEFSSVTASKVYSSATNNDYFIAGVSGAGYIHPTEYPEAALADFTDLTAANMLKSDLEYVSILDSTPTNKRQEKKLCQSLEYYARYSNIKGGVLSLDPDRYEGGKGAVYFVNNKPFMSNRLSLWHPSGDSAEVTKEWLDEQADIINNYPADINTVNGYSVINIHPWTISIDNLAYFVNQLDEEVELVTLDELLTMVEENIPHKNAKPQQ